MTKIIIFVVSVVLFVSCNKVEESPGSLQKPTKKSLAAVRHTSKVWSQNQKGAWDLSEKDLLESLAALENIDLNLDENNKSVSLLNQAVSEIKSNKEFSRTQTQINAENIKPNELWLTKNNIYGFIEAGIGKKEITPAGLLQADDSLRGAKLKITLDRFKVKKYPGRGTHDIALNFYGQTQNEDQVTPLTYCLGVSAREDDEAGVVGKNIFIGLNAGTEGIDFKVSTINVNTSKDKTLFSIIAGQIFSRGLKLIDKVQPALEPLTALANGVSEELSKKNKGVPVNSFELGLDFSEIPFRIKLREGSFVIIQIPPAKADVWKWSDWEFKDGRIQGKSDQKVVPFNYIVIGISRMKS